MGPAISLVNLLVEVCMELCILIGVAQEGSVVAQSTEMNT